MAHKLYHSKFDDWFVVFSGIKGEAAPTRCYSTFRQADALRAELQLAHPSAFAQVFTMRGPRRVHLWRSLYIVLDGGNDVYETELHRTHKAAMGSIGKIKGLKVRPLRVMPEPGYARF